MSLTISVITPSYNQGHFIERTIQSVLSQGIPDLEYMVCDGGSTDETVDILRRYEDRLRWISEPDGGQADAVNKGVFNTSGDVIGWLNSDDIYYPGALRFVLDFFEQNPAVKVVYGDADHIDEHDAIIEPYYTEDWDYERLKDVDYLCQPAVFFRRQVVGTRGLLDPTLRYCMDYEYWLRLGANIKFVRLNRVLAGSRLYDANKTLGSRVAVHREIIEMTQKRLGQTPQRWIFNYAHAVVDARGYNHQVPAERVRRITLLLLVSISSFLRWYHYVPRSALQTMWEWMANPLYHTIREWLKR
jgi:glycosyltransferase involved in cell wall biosynthesis